MRVSKSGMSLCNSSWGRRAAGNELPDQVDHEQQADLLSKFRIDPKEPLGGGAGRLAARVDGRNLMPDG